MEEIDQEPWVAQLDELAVRRRDQRSFHVFAEGMHSDVRGEIKNLPEEGELTLPYPGWARHVFIVIGLNGVIDAQVGRWSYVLRPHSQLVIVPGMTCRLRAREASAIELLSLLSSVPQPTVERHADSRTD